MQCKLNKVFLTNTEAYSDNRVTTAPMTIIVYSLHVLVEYGLINDSVKMTFLFVLFNVIASGNVI